MANRNSTDALARVLVVVTPVLSAGMLALIGAAIRFVVKSTPKHDEPESRPTPWRFEPGVPGYRAEMRSVSAVGAENPHAPATPPLGIRRIGSGAPVAANSR